jgi:hypothetical protein
MVAKIFAIQRLWNKTANMYINKIGILKMCVIRHILTYLFIYFTVMNTLKLNTQSGSVFKENMKAFTIFGKIKF